MSVQQPARVEELQMEPLTKEEIDRRIGELIAEVAAFRAESDSVEGIRPRWISAKELVRRMQPFMVYN